MTMPAWLSNPAHHRWLLGEAHRLLDFYQYASLDPDGGFFELDDDGRPLPTRDRSLVVTARMIHNFSVAHLLGRPGAATMADHGLRFLAEAHHDGENGGYLWVVGPDGRRKDASKQAYGHAFVLLAASSAHLAERPGARDLLADATSVLEERFWSDPDGLYVEEWSEDWTQLGDYRGQNSNMHLVEALLAAGDATGDPLYVRRAERVAERLIRDLTAANEWVLVEHYDESWRVDREYNRDDPENLFRPYGVVVGHSPEWARLLVQLAAATGARDGWMLPAARRLFAFAVDEAWEESPEGFAYTLDYEGGARNRDRYHWVIAEAIGASALLAQVAGGEEYERWYGRFWDFVDRYFIDRERGSWYNLLSGENVPKRVPGVIEGKWDFYHALQACLVPMLSPDAGIALSLRDHRFRLLRAGAP